jgi:hypothetical protein
VENSDTFYFTLYARKAHIESENDGYMFKDILNPYVHILDGIATANGEVGISGSRSSPYQISPRMAKHGGPRDNSRFILVLL